MSYKKKKWENYREENWEFLNIYIYIYVCVCVYIYIYIYIVLIVKKAQDTVSREL